MLRLTTLALPAIHSIPAMMAESGNSPLSSQTWPMASRALGATPAYFPSDAAPVPAMIDATCVPCPK
jgi:hypothetical protein